MNVKADQIHVLVVDDNPAILRMLASMLGRAGFRITCASTPLDSMLALKERPDVVLLDDHFPPCHGIPVPAEIRCDPDHDDTAIVAMSCNGTDSGRRAALRSGCDGFIGKPFRLHDIALEILTAIAMRQRALSVGMKFDREEMLACAA